MIKEDDQRRVNQWVQNVVSDRWLDNLQAVKQWKEVAKIVGEEKTREEVLKLLDGNSIFLEFTRFDDRVLRVFVEEIGDFPKYIGGTQYTPKFIPILEKLCYCDDPYVRDRV